MVKSLLAVSMICGFSLLGAANADTASAPPSADSEITDRVSHKLLEADRDVAPRIHVSTVNGIVTLEGTVFTNSQALKVLSDAGAVQGVVKVRNRLHTQM